MTDKHHYRKVFKSDHLGVADLEDYIESGGDLIFTISHVRQEFQTKVAGRKINANIAYFTDQTVKPLVLNATNSKVMRDLTGSVFVEDWQKVPVQLFINYDAKLKGETVGGVRISPKRVNTERMTITPQNTKLWDRAVNSYKQTGNLKKVLEHADMSPEHQQLIMETYGV